jgi:hypothetical protein
MPSRFFSEDDLQKGERLCKEGRVGEIIFSGGTYQVEVKEGRKQFWPFLQISDEGQLKDHLCSCHGSEASSFCAHQAAAWIKIFNGKHVVLHLRFQQSFWYQIFQLAARRQGYETSFFKKSSDSLLEASSSTGRLLFSIKAHTAQGKKHRLSSPTYHLKSFYSGKREDRALSLVLNYLFGLILLNGVFSSKKRSQSTNLFLMRME